MFTLLDFLTRRSVQGNQFGEKCIQAAAVCCNNSTGKSNTQFYGKLLKMVVDYTQGSGKRLMPSPPPPPPQHTHMYEHTHTHAHTHTHTHTHRDTHTHGSLLLPLVPGTSDGGWVRRVPLSSVVLSNVRAPGKTSTVTSATSAPPLTPPPLLRRCTADAAATAARL